jgi:hypothetical protein
MDTVEPGVYLALSVFTSVISLSILAARTGNWLENASIIAKITANNPLARLRN